MSNYRTTYQIEFHGPDGIPREEIKEGWGACDSMLFVSIIGRVNGPGPLSMAFLSGDGYADERQELTPEQKFSVWAAFANHLKEILPGGPKRELCELVFTMIQRAVTGDAIKMPYMEQAPFDK
jgi:hypothetical protein